MEDQKRYVDLSGASRARPRSQAERVTPQSIDDAESRQRLLLNRLARIEGHVRSIQKMITQERRADEVLIQVAAVKAALNKFSATYITQELQACLREADPGGERFKKATDAMTILMKQS